MTSRWDNYVRVWSDGRVDYFDRPVQGDCSEFTLIASHGAVDHPFPVTNAVRRDSGTVLLTFTNERGEDGRVDLIGNGQRCTLEGIGTPSFCTADVDRNGSVGIEDFLMVLAQWGCQ